MEQGQSIPLPDGSALGIKINKTWLSTNMQLSRNGKPLPGTNSDIYSRLAISYSAIFIIAALNFFSGLAAIIFNESDALLSSLITIGIGIIFVILGFYAKKLSMAAIIIALVIYGIDTIMLLVQGNTSGVIVHIIFISAITQGINAIKAIRADAEIDKIISPNPEG